MQTEQTNRGSLGDNISNGTDFGGVKATRGDKVSRNESVSSKSNNIALNGVLPQLISGQQNTDSASVDKNTSARSGINDKGNGSGSGNGSGKGANGGSRKIKPSRVEKSFLSFRDIVRPRNSRAYLNSNALAPPQARKGIINLKVLVVLVIPIVYILTPVFLPLYITLAISGILIKLVSAKTSIFQSPRKSLQTTVTTGSSFISTSNNRHFKAGILQRLVQMNWLRKLVVILSISGGALFIATPSNVEAGIFGRRTYAGSVVSNRTGRVILFPGMFYHCFFFFLLKKCFLKFPGDILFCRD